MNIKQLVIKLSQSIKSLKNGVFYANRYFCGKNTAQKIGNLSMSTTENLPVQSAEYGRSMVEMLGVLAVIGVLSVTAILGYRYAMTKYIANETINEINLRARDISFDMEAMIENNYNGDIEMKMGPITRMGYPITARTSPQYIDYFEIFVKEVPTDVCKELLRMPWQAPYSIFVGVEEFEASINICEQAETVELAYEFYKDMSSKDEIDEDNRHEIMRCKQDSHCICGTCNIDTGLCESYCLDSQTCKKDYDDSRWMVCCDEDYIVGDFCCASVTADGQCCNREGRCCPTEKPLQDKDGNCHSCDEEARVNLEGVTSNCSVCNNRFLAGTFCVKTCPNGYFMDKNGACRDCMSETAYSVHGVEENCNACSNRFVDNAAPGNYCYLKCDSLENGTEGKPLHGEYGQCYSCNDKTSINVNGQNMQRCHSICNNRLLFGNTSMCNLACPPEKPLMINISGDCSDCLYPDKISVSSINGDCSKLCPNRKEKDGYCVLSSCPDGYFMDKDGACRDCMSETAYSVHGVEENCNACSNRFVDNAAPGNYCYLKCDSLENGTEGKPLHGEYGQCYSCNDKTSINVNGQNMQRCHSICNNRLLFGNTSMCNLACPPEKPLMINISGDCSDCLYPDKISVSSINGDCSKLCPNRKEKDGYCVLSSCPDGYFMDKDGACRDCMSETAYSVHGVEENCNACSNRFVDNAAPGNYCYLKCDSLENGTEGKPLHGEYGQCYSCNDKTSINVNGQNMQRCHSICNNRELSGSMCNFMFCSEATFLADNNECYPCNITTAIKSTDEECQKCLNTRVYENGYCKLNY